jgi:hypothetical protein
MVAIPQILRIDQAWIDQNKVSEEDLNRSLVSRLYDYTATAIGALRSLQVAKGVATLYNELAETPSPVATQLRSSTGAAISGLGLARLPSATLDAANSLSDVAQDGTLRKAAIAIKDSMDAVGTWIYSAILLTGKSTFIGVAKLSDLVVDAVDWGISTSDLSSSKECAKVATGEVKKAFDHTTNYQMLRVAKATLSVASALLAGGLFLIGAPVLSTMAMTALSLTTALVAIRRDLYKDEGLYPVIKFDRPLTV